MCRVIDKRVAIQHGMNDKQVTILCKKQVTIQCGASDCRRGSMSSNWVD